MRSQRICAGIAFAGFCLSGLAFGATSLGRQYAFGFEYGNLLRNWSFENTGDGWLVESMVSTRLLAKSVSISAVSGSYVARFIRTDGTGAVDKVACDLFPIEPSQQYTLSFYVKTSGNTSGVHPVVFFYSNRSAGSALTPVTGGNYAVNTDWTLVALTFTAPSTSTYAKVALAQAANGQTGTFYFDDAVLEKTSTASDRTRIQESVSFMDEFNQRIQGQVKLAGGGNSPAGRTYLVQALELDGQKRPIKSFSPFLNSGNPDFDPGFATKAGTYNNGNNGIGSQGSYPYAKVDYLSEPGDPIGAAYGPATPWSTTPSKSGAYFVATLTAPATDPDAPPQNNNEAPYLLSWSKDVENRYSCSWTDQSGQLLQTAVKSGGAWIYTRFEYFPDGRIKKVLSPLDVPGIPAQQEYRKVTHYNSAGQMTSAYTKDRGLRKYWYNRLGNPRFSRHETQAADEYDYTDYDFLERPISVGTQVISGFTQANADQRATASSIKSEQIGYLYDNLDAFASRTGFALSAILPGKTVGVNGQGRLVCDYNLNRGIDLPFISAQDKFVATFYNYNKYGEVTEAYKYIGSVRDPARRIHKATLTYDGRHRLLSTTLQDNQATPATLSSELYSYDAMDRVIQINGLGGKFLSSYQYYDWGKPKSVVLGGTGASNTGTRIDFAYHAQGWLQSITATSRSTNHIVFQQFLGYEGKAVDATAIPAPLQTKMDGSISQQLYKFTEDMNSLGSIRMLNYQYDDFNRLLTADARRNSNSDPMDNNQAMYLSSLQWTDTEDMDTRTTFDAVGRILTHRNGVSAADKATYTYQTDSYKLDHVSGKLGIQSGRDASPAGTFVYDGRGRMVADKSKNLFMHYGWDDMPLELAIESPGFLLSEFNFYDAYGQRVSRLHTETPNLVPVTSLDGITFFVKRPLEKADALARPTSGIADVNLIANGTRRWTEQYDNSWQVTSSAGQTGLSGVSGQIGEITASGAYRYFVKNNQGSTMATVDDQGLYESGRAMDYLAYGSTKDLKINGDEPVVPKFTGKELELLTGLYAFGARWYDPELGVWISPDVLDQFSDPFSYVGGNTPNLVDPNGMVACEQGEDALELPEKTVKCPKPDPDNLLVAAITLPIAAGWLVYDFLSSGGGSHSGPSVPEVADATSVDSDYRPPQEERMRYYREDPDLNYLKHKEDAWDLLRNDEILQGIRVNPTQIFTTQVQLATMLWGAGSLVSGATAFYATQRLLAASASEGSAGLAFLNSGATAQSGGRALTASAVEGLDASSMINGIKLAQKLAGEEAASVFTAEGFLTPKAIQGSRQIIAPGELGNSAIPKGFGKYSTETFHSPSGPFQVHFYMNPGTRKVFYRRDFKAVFNNGISPFGIGGFK